MDSNKLQCDQRHHVPGKGWKKCTYYATHEVYVPTSPTVTEWVRLCKKHYDLVVEANKMILIDHPFPSMEICPECGAVVDFTKGIPICTGDHPIGSKTQHFFTERYPELYSK